MKNAVSLLIKFIYTMVAAWIAFSIFGTIAVYTLISIGVVATLLSFAIGDMWVLSRFGNLAASLINGVISGATAYIALLFFPVTYAYWTPILVFAAVVAAVEYFYHMYLVKSHIVEKKKSGGEIFRPTNFNFKTETADELHPHIGRDHPDKGIYNENNSSDYKNNTNRL
ncbi:DUF2512 family protein [Anoxybacterium hadale]|uniref:DUF2512 family protein n=1 Tax=Anoxybacterium hadale TaxID=3408580 RepID=A0ACD1A8A8_9FIRM|nr:DUF2512 family protein [Clostridiales bacterium]